MNGFLYVIDDARSSLERVLEGRSEHELTGLHDHAGWSVKDHLDHMAAWERGMIYLLTRRPRHEGMGIDEQTWAELDEDAVNDVIKKKNQGRSLSEVMDTFHSTHREMVELLSSMSFDDLQKPYSHYDPDVDGENRDQPVLFWVFGNTAGHFDMHQEWIEAILEQGRE